MKKIIMLFIIMFVTGCSAKYNLYIKDGTIEESIDFSLVKKGIVDDDMVESSYGSDEYIDTIVSSKLSAIGNDEKNYYQKEVNQDGNIYNFHLYYKYIDQQYTQSNIINECFENHVVKIEGKNVYIHLSGKFNCYNGENIDIEVKSDNNVKKHNGSKSGSTYYWQINQDNYNNVDIMIETNGESKTRNYIYYAIAIIAGIGTLLFLMYFIGNIMGRNNVNDI